MKKWTKILCCVLLVGLFSICTLTGCATVGNIKNSSNELIYNGNSAVMVDGYLYYGNAYADISGFSSDGDYKSSAKTSYLARVNTNEDLGAKTKDFSPKSVETVSEEVTAYSNSFMFVLGQNIYYATPNRQKVSNNGSTTNEYSYTCIYVSKLNGDGKKKLYTTTAAISQMEVLKTENTYYIVFLAGDRLIKINLSNNKAETVAEGVKSVAIPKTYQKDKVGSTLDWNGYLYFTKALSVESGSGETGDVVNRVKLSGGEEEQIYQGSSVSLVGREKDVVFFTEKEKNLDATESYMVDLSTNSSKTAFDMERVWIQTSAISDIQLITSKTANGVRDLGYIFTVGSDLGFKINGGSCGIVSFKNGEETLSSYKILLVTGRTIYLSNTTNIFRADVSQVFDGGSRTVQVETIVTMAAIYDGAFYAFDGSYIYYYAGLEEVEPEKDKDGNDIEPEADDNYYLYRAKVGAVDSYQLLGKTSISSRRS